MRKTSEMVKIQRNREFCCLINYLPESSVNDHLAHYNFNLQSEEMAKIIQIATVLYDVLRTVVLPSTKIEDEVNWSILYHADDRYFNYCGHRHTGLFMPLFL